MPKVAFKQSDVVRAIRAAQVAGLTVSGVEIAPDGTIRVLTGDVAAAPRLSPYDAWKAQRRRDEPDLDDPDNPEWTAEDFARARPASEVLPPEVIAAFGKAPKE
jgi:hypothetical protein